MLRVTIESSNSEAVVLSVAGRIAAEDVVLLEEEGRCRFGEGRRWVLDLEGVRFIDQDGLDLLQRWVREGMVLRGGSLFVRALLAEKGVG